MAFINFLELITMSNFSIGSVKVLAHQITKVNQATEKVLYSNTQYKYKSYSVATCSKGVHAHFWQTHYANITDTLTHTSNSHPQSAMKHVHIGCKSLFLFAAVHTG